MAIEHFAKEDAPFPPEKTKYIVRRCKNKKNDINGLWMNTEYGQWVLLASKRKIQEANELLEKIKSKPPWNIEQVSKELNVQIAKAFDSVDDFEDYLRLLEKDDDDLVDFIISHDVFGKVYEILM